MPRIAFLFLANHAEVRDGLLNVLGGGWNRHLRSLQPDGTPTISHFSIVAGVAFDPGDSNQTHFSLRIVSDQGDTVVSAEGQAQVGDETAPITQLVIAAITAEVRWTHAGAYRLTAGLGANQPESQFAFIVVDRQSPA